MIDPLIYRLVDPRDGSVFYVGQTYRGSVEPEGYVKTAHRGNMRRKVFRYLRSLSHAGISAEWVELEVPSVEDLDDAEQFWIASLSAAGAQLMNMSPGGRGNRTKPSEETRAKTSQSCKGTNRGPKTEAHRAKLRAAMIGRPRNVPHTAEAIEKMRKAQQGRIFSEEHKLKLRAAKARRRAEDCR